MIEYMGLVVGVLESPIMQELANKCAKFLKKYPHLLDTKDHFMIDGAIVLTLSQTSICEDNTIIALFHDYNGKVVIGTSDMI